MDSFCSFFGFLSDGADSSQRELHDMVGVGLNIVDSRIVASASLSPPVHPFHEHRNNALAYDACCAEPNLRFGGMRAEEFTNEAFHLLAQGAEVFSCNLVKQAGRAG